MTQSSRLARPAGEFTRRVTIETVGARVDDGYGGGSVAPTTFLSRRAKIEPLAGEERFVNGQFDPSLSHRITFRYYAGIKPHMQVKYGTRLFDIKYVADLEEAHRDVVLMCEELVTW